MFGRKPQPAKKAEVDVVELRRLLTQSHRLIGRLIGSTKTLEEVDFGGIAEGWIHVARDFRELEGMAASLVPLARAQDLMDRIESISRRRGKRGEGREAQSA